MVRGTAGPNRFLVGLDTSMFGRSLIGGKGASLGHLAALGAPVPKALALTTHAYALFAASAGLPARASETPPFDLRGIRAAIMEAPLPAPIGEAIDEAWAAFESAIGPDVALAVRSSATSEDSADHSFAGLYDTLLDVRSPAALEAAIRKCWASLWSDRAVSYRRAGGLAEETAAIAVVIQQLVRSDVSFVVFTADPVSGSDTQVVISASWGLGESVVSGIVTPDHIVVGPDCEILEYIIGHKETMIIPGASPTDGPRQVAVPRALHHMPVFTPGQATNIAGMARSLADRLGYPVDLEGGIADNAVHLFQARPITTLTLHAKLAATAAGTAPSNAPRTGLNLHATHCPTRSHNST